MNKILTFLLLLFGCMCQAQDRIIFSYDAAGNQITRQLCISNCQTAKTGKTIKDVSALIEEDLEKFFPEDQFSYYPNPVKEELYLSWKVTSEKQLVSINVFSILGQRLISFKTLKMESQNISFKNFPQGMYLVMLQYSDGEEKSIKIIKQ